MIGINISEMPNAIGGVLEILNNLMRNVHVERKRGLSERGSLNYLRISFDVLSRGM